MSEFETRELCHVEYDSDLPAAAAIPQPCGCDGVTICGTAGFCLGNLRTETMSSWARAARLPWVSQKTIRRGLVIPNPRGIEIIEAFLDHAARFAVDASLTPGQRDRYRHNAWFMRLLDGI